MITIEHDHTNYIICRASGTLTKEDYAAAVPELLNAIDLRQESPSRGHRPRLLVLLEDFRGWELDALWPELRFDLEHRDDFDRIAVVGESRLEAWGTTLAKPFFNAEMRYFGRDERAQAEAWLRE